MKRFTLLAFMAVLALNIWMPRMYAQQAVTDFLQGGVNDARLLAGAYLKPLGHGIGSSLNSGWFNTGRVHRTLGFNVTFSVSGSLIPEADRMFDMRNLAFENLQLRNQAQHMAPTIFGQMNTRPALHFTRNAPPANQPVTILEFASPNGFETPAVPMPMVRAGIGLPGGFEVFGRFLPEVTFENHTGSLWGAGLKYNLKQLIPIARHIPFVNISVLGAFTSLNAKMDLDFQRTAYPQTVGGLPVTGGRPNYDNQFFEMNVTGYTFNVIGSVDIPFVSAFASVGYASSTTSLSLLGDYPMLNVTPTGPVISDVSNPMSLDFVNQGEVQMIVGATLKLAILHIHASYTLARYPVATAGIGISFR